MNSSQLKYKIALSFVQGVGIINDKNLIAYIGSIDGIFKEKKENLTKIQGIGPLIAQNIKQDGILAKAEEEIEYLQRKNIHSYFYLDAAYPEKLKHCPDAPVLIYQEGETDLDHDKIISIVGTRQATNYGKEICTSLIESLAERGHDVVIVSGLAHGIDSYAHKAALKHNLKTIAVLGHGLNTVYPAANRSLANSIKENGSLLTEFTSEAKPDRPNFVKRNRIIAGLAQATIVVESGVKGGALITADLANSYNRDVFAYPGKITDKYSAGCNWLIKTNKAALIEKVEDLEYILGWDVKKQKVQQKELFYNLSEIESSILKIIEENMQLNIDQISLLSKLPMSKVSSNLLNLEFAGFIKCLPGKVYKSTV